MTTHLAKARLIPFRDPPNANQPDVDARAIPFDFNPETLTLKVSSREARDEARRSRQQTQNVGASQATLSFECLFDSTRPRSSDGPESEKGKVDRRDVRRRTKAIADLLQAKEPGGQGTPRRVRFHWGSFIFDGVVSQHQELFDYFSPEGVPLRSKVTLTLTEKNFRYDVTAEKAAPLRDGASTLESGSGANDAPPSPEQRSEAALVAAVLPGVAQPSQARIGQALAAGVSLGAREALGLFGAAALPAGLDLSRSALAGAGDGGSAVSPRRTPQPGQPTSSWAREAAPPQSAPAGLAAQVASQRQGGLDSGTRQQASQSASPVPPVPPDPPPIQGHAPLRARLALQPDPRLFPQPLLADRPSLERRPLWEGLPVTSLNPRFGSGAGAATADCGCDPCGQGGRP